MSKKKKKIPNEQGETQIQIQRLIGRIYTNALSIPAVQSAIKDKDEDFFFQTNNNAKREMQSLTKRMSKQLDALLLNAIKGEWEQGYLDFENDLKRLDDNTAQALKLRQAFRDEATQSARLAGARAFFEQQRGGLTISQRVWNLANNAQKELEIVIQNGIKQGKSPGEVAKSLKEYLNKPEALFRGVKNKETGKTELSNAARKYKPGQGVYRSAYKNALRLARTEMKQAYHSAQWQAGQANPLIVGWRISLSNNHTTLKGGKPTPFRDMCDELVGEYPKDFKFTGWHPQCRCVMTPILATPAERKSLYRSIFENGTTALQGGNATQGNTPPPRPLPNNFKQWLQNNKQRLGRAKTPPHFIQLNKTIIQGTNQKTNPLEPPQVHTYKEHSKGVYVSPYHGKNELNENVRLAKFIVKKLGKKVYLLPLLDPLNPKHSLLRNDLLPAGIFENKNPDFLIKGEIYDAKVMKVGEPVPLKKQKGKIENKIKSAKEQATNFIIEVPHHYSKEVIDATITNYQKRTSEQRVILIKHGNELYRY